MGAVYREFKPSVGRNGLKGWFGAKQDKAAAKDPDLMTQGDVHMCGELNINDYGDPYESIDEARRRERPWRGQAVAVRYREPGPLVEKSRPGLSGRTVRYLATGKGPIRWLVMADCPN